MLFDADPEPFIQSWKTLNREAQLHGITLITTAYPGGFRLLQPKEGLNSHILVSALQRGMWDIVSDNGGKGRAVAVEDPDKLQGAKLKDQIIAPRLKQMMKAEFPWALIAFAEGAEEDFWHVYYALGPVFNLAAMATYSGMILGDSLLGRPTDPSRKPLYTRMESAGKQFADAMDMLIPS